MGHLVNRWPVVLAGGLVALVIVALNAYLLLGAGFS
jgi:Zn-dependent protease with chaperone function